MERGRNPISSNLFSFLFTRLCRCRAIKSVKRKSLGVMAQEIKVQTKSASDCAGNLGPILVVSTSSLVPRSLPLDALTAVPMLARGDTRFSRLQYIDLVINTDLLLIGALVSSDISRQLIIILLPEH